MLLINFSLYQACGRGELARARQLIQQGANVNFQHNYGLTPLHRACYNGRLEIVRFLLQKGADIHAQTNYGRTSLHSVCHGAKLSSNNYDRCAEIAKLLIEKGADINVRSNHGEIPWELICNDDRTGKFAELLNQRSQTPVQAVTSSSPMPTTQSNGHTCSICEDNTSDHAISPCGHVYCLGCINRVRQTSPQCPSCRRPIQSVMKLFF